MNATTTRRVKVVLGLLLGTAIGASCRCLDIPAPAPPVITGALLVVAMTAGYLATDRWFARREAAHRALCGGPDGSTRADA